MRRAVVAVLSVVALVASGSPASAAPPPAPPPGDSPGYGGVPQLVRVAGAERVATSVELSQRVFGDDAVDTAVLATAFAYADALTGGPLAAAHGGPLLLTPPDGIPPVVLDELDRLGVDDVVVLGGTSAVSTDAVLQLIDDGYRVRRLAGPTRFETAARIADAVDALVGGVDTVMVVEGIDADPSRGWPDAVSSSWYAGMIGAAILPVDTDVAPQVILDTAAELEPSDVVVVGGSDAVSDATAEQFSEDYRRLAGATRYETSGAVYDEAVTGPADPSGRWLATGQHYPDALTAGPVVAAAGQGLLLVDGGAPLAGSPGTIARLLSAFDRLEVVALVGGQAVLGQNVREVVAETVQDVGFAPSDYCLTVLHNNDGESRLVDAGAGLEAYGGVARFGQLLRNERAFAAEKQDDATNQNCTESVSITLNSGDNFLAGPQFQASLDLRDPDGDDPAIDDGPFFDTVALDYLQYDAFAIGNHEFDFGPNVLADFIVGFEDGGGNPPDEFVSANLNIPASVPDLNALVGGKIVPTTTFPAGSKTIGVVGLTTPLLDQVSSPGDVTVDDDLVTIVTDAVTQLRDPAGGDADIVILISHLQDLDADLDLLAQLSGIDLAVGGGGDEVLALPGEMLVPGDENAVYGAYPQIVQDSDGEAVPVVTTAGDYRYVGRLVTRFDEDGGDTTLTSVDPQSRMVRVNSTALPGGVAPDTFLQDNVVDPVADYLDTLDTPIGSTTVPLDGQRASVRTVETNLGNLMADGMIDEVDANRAAYAVAPGDHIVAIQNGGGIRNNTVIPAGDLTTLDTFGIAPFSNLVVAFDAVSIADLKSLLEHAYSEAPDQAGFFAQIGGMAVEYDSAQPAGSRVRTVTLIDGPRAGEAVVTGGAVAAGPPAPLALTTIDFLARDGDGYDFPDTPYVNNGVTYQKSLENKIEAETPIGTDAPAPEDPGYQPGGEGRITAL